jgi:hypothetical protein
MMKRNIFAGCAALLLAATPMTVSAQTLNVTGGNVTYAFPASITGEMVVTGGTTVNIAGRDFTLSEVSRMYVDQSSVKDNTVTVAYNGDSATVVIAGNIAQYVSATVSGANVVIKQSDNVGDDTCGEITYSLSGSSENGNFQLNGDYKSTIELQGLTLTNPSGAVLDIQNGKRIELSAKNGTVNTLVDGASGSQKGCIYCKGHLEFKGKGTLNVTGNKSHAINAKEYVEMKNLTLNVLGSVKDGINCNQYFSMESGTLNISGVGDDGLQVSYKDDTDREAEDTGSITVTGGTITISVTADASKGMKADGDVTISGGTFDITVSGGGVWDSDDTKTKASSCISADGDITVSGGTFDLKATGSGGKGFNSDGGFTQTDGDIVISTTGGMYAYVNGKEYDNYTGNTDRLDSDYKSSPKGIKADGNVQISGGTMTVSTTGNGGEGIESKSELTISGGTIVVNAYDDCINSSSHMYIDGGDITVISANNDGLDSNGNLYIRGGVTRAFGTTSPECGIDANTEEGYTVIVSGGALLAVGSSNSTPNTSKSTQGYLSTSASITAGTDISVKSGDTVLATFTVPEGFSGSSSSNGGGNGGWGWNAPATAGPGGGGGGGWGGNSSYNVIVTAPGMTRSTSYTFVNGSSSSTLTAK